MSTSMSEGSSKYFSNVKQDTSFFEASLFATVLEDTITELRIVSECNYGLRFQKALFDMNLLLAHKFGIAEAEATDELDGIDPRNLGRLEYKLKKLEADRNLAINTMVSVYKNLTIERSYSDLTNYVKGVVEQKEYRIRLQVDESKNRSQRRDLSKQLRQLRNHIKTVLYDTEATIDNLKTQVEDSVLVSECRNRYTDNWQLARTEQHIQTIKDIQRVPLKSIENYKQRSDNEHRVHSEVEQLTAIAINETLEKVEEWMTRYDKDMEGMDLKIQIRKNEYHDIYEARLALEDKIEKHDTLMKEWIEFKDKREKLRLYREKMNNAAITVQAWWRGMLVRRQLGPYKVPKKKKAPPEKKKY